MPNSTKIKKLSSFHLDFVTITVVDPFNFVVDPKPWIRFVK